MSGALIELLRQRFAEAVTGSHGYRGDATVVLRSDALVEVMQFLRDDDATRMNLLADVTAIDYLEFGQRPEPAFFASSGVSVGPSSQIPDENPWPGPPDGVRFTVVYHLYSTAHKHRLRVVVPAGESDPEVDSVTGLWRGASWLEREVWDMYGVRFKGHPNLKRILMYEEFQGHPLRKDYPVNKRQPLIGPVN